jgi:hypothetical protein
MEKKLAAAHKAAREANAELNKKEVKDRQVSVF